MAKVTEKNTKKEILEAYEAVVKQLSDTRAAKTTTADVVKEKEVKAVKEAAKEIVGLGILNEEVTGKYNSLISTIEMLEKDIQDLYGIKKQADSLEALINVYKDKNDELVAGHKEEMARLQAEHCEKVAANNAEIEKIKAEAKKTLEDVRNAHKEETNRIAKERQRENEEYAYNLKRIRDKENDVWEDEKATRERILADKEAAVALREADAEVKCSKFEAQEAEIETLKAEIKATYEKGVKDGEAQAEKVTAIKIAKANQECEFKVSVAEAKVESLTASNAELKAQANELQGKLDAASTRVQEMAIKVAENSGVRMLESNNK